MKFSGSYSDFTPRQGIVFSVFLFIAGLVILFFVWLPLFYKGWQSRNWPTIEGVIVESHNWNPHMNGSSRSSGVTYKYDVRGITYSSKRVEFGSNFSSEKTGEESLANRYPKDRKVNVYYKSDDPSMSVLEPGILWGTFFVPGGAIFLLYIGIRGLKLHIRALKGKNINQVTYFS